MLIIAGRDCLVIHFGLDKFDMKKVMDDCAALEACLMPYEVRLDLICCW